MSKLSRSFFIIHGTGGSPQGNWFPWISSELKKLGQEVAVPQFPLDQQQNLSNWFKAFEATVGQLTSGHVLVGHSIGAAFVLRLLERASVKVAGAVLVAPFARQLDNPDFDPFNATFVEPAFDWTKIRKAADKFIVYSGDNDPYVPTSVGAEVARELGCECNLIEGGGHLNASSGYLSFERLLGDLRKAFL